MAIQIIHGGQTGVDRGAHRGALANRFGVGGFMPADARDERGPIPEDVTKHLWPCVRAGNSARTKLNVESAHALLVVVHDRMNPWATPGTKYTLDCARAIGLRYRFIADTETKPSELMAWAKASLVVSRSFHLMVAGPRASLWPEGERVTMSLLDLVGVAIGSPVQCPPNQS